MSTAERLYTPELLALTVRLAAYPWSDGFERSGEARSKSCGSSLMIGFDLDRAGSITRIGMRARACAVGQASAAIFADAAGGLDLAAIEQAHGAMRDWLSGHGALPQWRGIEAILPAHAYPARHGAMLLPWQAALAALSTAQPSG